jgi:CheY-like chemotaxis protein
MTPEDPPSPTAVVASGDEETRVLLRGLLRLHHYRVVGEAEGSTRALEQVEAHHPRVLVVDLNLAEGSALRLMQESRTRSRGLRVILVTPGGRPSPVPAGANGPDVVLARPFRIRQFAEALGVPEAPPPSTTA